MYLRSHSTQSISGIPGISGNEVHAQQWIPGPFLRQAGNEASTHGSSQLKQEKLDEGRKHSLPTSVKVRAPYFWICKVLAIFWIAVL